MGCGIAGLRAFAGSIACACPFAARPGRLFDFAVELILQLFQLAERPLERLGLVAEHRFGSLFEPFPQVPNRFARLFLQRFGLRP